MEKTIIGKTTEFVRTKARPIFVVGALALTGGLALNEATSSSDVVATKAGANELPNEEGCKSSTTLPGQTTTTYYGEIPGPTVTYPPSECPTTTTVESTTTVPETTTTVPGSTTTVPETTTTVPGSTTTTTAPGETTTTTVTNETTSTTVTAPGPEAPVNTTTTAPVELSPTL